MGNKSNLIFSGVLLLGILFLSACNNSGSSLEESVKPYLELQAVDGASNVTMTVNRGASQGLDSYFALDFTNFESDGIVKEGLTEGWCLDYQKPIDQNNDVHEGIKMFNTFGSENWKPANYLMNIKDELKQNDPSITYKEIQIALWSLIEKPSFNIDKALSEGTMPSRLMTNGSPNFSVEKTKGIVNKVRKEVDDFVYKPGTPVIVYSNTHIDDQDVGSVEGETAWGFSANTDGTINTQNAIEFCENTTIQSSNWGWTNGLYSDASDTDGIYDDSDTFIMIAGAGGCDITKEDAIVVGSFSFNYDGGTLTYTLDLDIENDFTEIQIYAGSDLLPIGNNNNYITAPGGNNNGLGNRENLDPHDFDINGPELSGTIENLSGDIHIAVHLGS
jgi:hypothetical protein